MTLTSSYRLHIVGLGIAIPGHITEQARQTMTFCTKIVSIIQESPSVWLPSKALNRVVVVNALEWYKEGIPRIDNYDYVASRIIEEVERGENIAYVTYGNPMAYDRVAQNLVALASESGITLQVVPGVSSLDTVFCDLRIDLAPGIQVYESSWFVAYQINPRLDVPLLLMQPSAFGSFRTHYSKRLDGSSLEGLLRYLLLFYSKSHGASLVRSTGDSNRPAIIKTITLGKLCSVTTEDLSGASLYIPSFCDPEPCERTLDEMIGR